MPFYLKGKSCSESWSVLIGNAAGRADEIYSNIKENLESNEIPDLEVVDKDVAPGLIAGWQGRKRRFLQVRNTSLVGFRIFIGASDYGKQLSVWWYMVPLTKMWKRRKGMFKGFPAELDIFDTQDLTSFMTTVHRAVVDASKEVSESVGFDFSQVDRKSRGFLNVS